MLANWIPAKKGVDQGDWELHDTWFSLARSLWRCNHSVPWTVDAAADISGRNAKFDWFYHRERSFLTATPAELQGRAIWANPDYRKLDSYVAKLRVLNRVGIPSCIVCPYTPDRKWWSVLKDNFEMVCVIPRKWRAADGSYIFSRPAQTAAGVQGRESPGPPPWDVSIWFSKSLSHKQLVVANSSGYA